MGTSKSRQRSQTARYFLWLLFYFYSKVGNPLQRRHFSFSSPLYTVFQFQQIQIKIIAGTFLSLLWNESVVDEGPGVTWYSRSAICLQSDSHYEHLFSSAPLRRSLAQDWCSVIHQALKPRIKKKAPPIAISYSFYSRWLTIKTHIYSNIALGSLCSHTKKQWRSRVSGARGGETVCHSTKKMFAPQIFRPPLIWYQFFIISAESSPLLVSRRIFH